MHQDPSRAPSQLRHSTDTTINEMLERVTDSNADDKLRKKYINCCTLMYKVCINCCTLIYTVGIC